MKKTILILFLVIEFLFVLAQENQKYEIIPKVDERQELLSIIFRLGGSFEYNYNDFEKYSQDVDNYFKPYINHKAVKYATRLRKFPRIGFERPSTFAYHIQIKNDTITFLENTLENSMVDWNKKKATKFLFLLNDFYRTSNFKNFYKENIILYTIAENRFDTVMQNVDISWFYNYYGTKTNGDMNIIISMLNGRNNYATKVQNKDSTIDKYAILGTCQTDSLGMPRYSNGYVDIVIHEFNHSYCNPLIDKYFTKLQLSSDKIFDIVSKKMRKNYYPNTKYMLHETLVRASVIKYVAAYWGENKAKYLMCQDMFKGFIFIEKVVNLLDIYENDRIKFPTLDSFMPEIIKLFDTLNIEKIKSEYDNNCANIIKTSIDDCRKNVNTNLTEIKIYFDKPMNTDVGKYMIYSIHGKTIISEFNSISWNKTDKQDCTLNITLKPNTEYKIIFSGYLYMTDNYYPLLKNYELKFKTK